MNIYLSLIILMIVLIIVGMDLCKYSPIKIKVFTKICLLLLFLRSVSLIIMFLSSSIKYLYLLRYFTFIDVIIIPLLGLMIIYILARNNKINFYMCYYIGLFLIAVYLWGVVKFDYRIDFIKNYGYLISIENDALTFTFQLILYTIILFFSIFLLFKLNYNVRYNVFLVVTCCISILEIIFYLININIIPNFLITNCMWLILVNSVLIKFNKR